MQARILPEAEWSKLKGTELSHLATLSPAPPGITVLVVEDDRGQLLACWASFLAWHVEGLWQAAGARGNPGVGRALLGAMIEHLRASGAGEVLTQAIDANVETLLRKLGGRPVPGQLWCVTLGQE